MQNLRPKIKSRADSERYESSMKVVCAGRASGRIYAGVGRGRMTAILVAETTERLNVFRPLLRFPVLFYYPLPFSLSSLSASCVNLCCSIPPLHLSFRAFIHTSTIMISAMVCGDSMSVRLTLCLVLQ